ncbi:dihydrolipoyllysine-residue acetyltransferase component 1 of pyruvate dehydrogenase, mitochondrial [Raphidocelis subcapitata]|uniref:Dihydrolipoyllysine-residue acetyltransferase component 1 of pyruvate dehydrogenase, mitochondrial n=1 Tax=Raphidocelis subcapitata TaxID=307507 RepID=A0A2V0P8N6_9CHLO|nr:dihydrolipoyllysine-residue acetyltransferase component 1 of pyruvate dehydrogenase, mitochondrial [Raphidocelis subcapitata]|eukprot:GBF93517.1 dihydrolipoyllysine-residue acetyltransferase component 1 of pyruvate dehydrogenase, mitochondrial [Raphidocelis subcapitata]
MPKLSHEMGSGRIARWLKREGDYVEQYDLVCEIETEQLVEEAYRIGDFAGSVTLLIESQEEGLLARTLAPEGAALPVGAPIALVAEGVGEGAAPAARAAALAAAAAWQVGTSDVYDSSQPAVRVLEWQSYLRDSKEEPGGRKCMG